MSGSEAKTGHRSRLRQRFLNGRFEGMHDYEVLELLLTFTIVRRDVKPLAKELLAHFGSLSRVFDAGAAELCEVKGVSDNTAVMIKLLRELCTLYLERQLEDADVLSSADEVLNFVRMKLGHERDEFFMTIYLNAKNRVICHEIAASGTVDQAVVFPRNILRRALEVGATALILVHNHPSGVAEPSRNDIVLTEKIREVVEVCDIKVLDHIIVGHGGGYSFHKNKLL